MVWGAACWSIKFDGLAEDALSSFIVVMTEVNRKLLKLHIKTDLQNIPLVFFFTSGGKFG